MIYTEGLIEISFLPYPVVCFIYCVEKVCDNDCHLYPSSVFLVSGRAWLGLRIAGTNRDAIVDGLDPSGD